MRYTKNIVISRFDPLGNLIPVVIPITSEDSGFVLAVASDGSITIEPVSSHALSGSYDATTLNTGGTLSPASGLDSEIVSMQGASAGTYQLAVSTIGRTAGDSCDITVLLPGISGVRVQVTNNTSGGAVIFDYRSDGSTLTFFAKLVFDGTQWQPKFFAAPAY